MLGTLAYYSYVPKQMTAGARVSITVHGISRRVFEHAALFAPFSEAQGIVLIAPYFPADRFLDYQRMSRVGRGETLRSDAGKNRCGSRQTYARSIRASCICLAIPAARNSYIATLWHILNVSRVTYSALRGGTRFLT